MLNLNPEEKYDERDLLMQEIEMALQEMMLREPPAYLSIRVSANLARYEMERTLDEPEPGFSFWNWLDRVIYTLTRPLFLVTAAIVVAFWFAVVANDPTWLHATSQLGSVGNSIGAFFASLFASLGQFYPALIGGVVLVAVIALTPRVRDLRQMLREEQNLGRAQ
jgi:hypothetical protein